MNNTDTSQKIRADILEAALFDAAFEGWTNNLLGGAAKKVGLPNGADKLYFPCGVLELIKFWHHQMNTQVWHDLQKLDLQKMKIRDKVKAGVLARFYAMGAHEMAAKRAISRLALPDAMGLAPSLLWGSADTIWRAIGDKSTDMNYYSKRTILSGVIGSSLVSWLADDDPNKKKARAFLDARIANVMQFETTKWKLKNKLKDLPDIMETIGSLRYGGKRRRY